MDWIVYKTGVSDYKPFYIQTTSDETAVDTREAFGMVAKVSPLPLLPSPKEPYKNDWKDEHGDEEYTKHVYYEAFTFDVSFLVKTYDNDYGNAASVLREQVRAFFDKVREGEFMVYDAYTGVGYSQVRYAGYKEEQFKSRKDWARAIFTISFKVNNPVDAVVIGADGKLKLK